MTTYETASDQFITVGKDRLAFRSIGSVRGVPLVLLAYFRGTMDHWDPVLINHLAARRHVVLIDNSGVGRSEGTIPKTIVDFAQVYIDAVRGIGFNQIDLMGFSLGGTVAQMMALKAPNLVRRLILCATIPSFGDGVVLPDFEMFGKLKAATTLEEHRNAFLEGFFTSSKRSQELGEAVWERITSSRPHRASYVDADGADKQAAAFSRFMNASEAEAGSYDRFDELNIPVLIANGSQDVLMPTENSILMWRKLKSSAGYLHLYPDSGHGFLFQQAESVAFSINAFLDNGL
ncbi:Alpha/Beta hydrolase protein [Thelonectria olida]|uniref:Alpha/Beta hydrolase protein n=1 Tax=Thelonectria olida TaxID=1576542 RepID=A0A9P9AEI5_9HYPO|nr:Alpha/Beta hydrolase protein [Thelonectria olida]